MIIHEINTTQHYCSVAFNKEKTPLHIAVMIGIADNNTIAIWNNQDGEQINIPFKDLGIKSITFETKDNK